MRNGALPALSFVVEEAFDVNFREERVSCQRADGLQLEPLRLGGGLNRGGLRGAGRVRLHRWPNLLRDRRARAPGAVTFS